MKECSKCKVILPLNQFYKRTDSKTIFYRSQCKSCTYNSRADYNKENRVKILKTAARLRQRQRGKTMLWISRNRAAKKGFEFNINENDLIIPKYCPILGIKLNFNIGKAQDNSPSLDRIDSSKGYIKGNIQVISNRANLLKNNATLDEIEKIYLFLKKLKQAF